MFDVCRKWFGCNVSEAIFVRFETLDGGRGSEEVWRARWLRQCT